MTSKESDKMEDAELDALLRGEGDLAGLLRTLPQAGPSAELDAAILAQAEAALRADGALGMPVAANDAVMPAALQAARPAVPGFMSRWKVPLAFAATVLVTVNMIGFEWFAAPWHAAPAALQGQLNQEAAPPPPLAAELAPASKPVRAAAPEAMPALAPTPVLAPPADSMSRSVVAPARRQAGRAAAVASAPGVEEKVTAPSVVARVDIDGTLTAASKPMAAPAPAPMSVAPMPARMGEAPASARMAYSSRMASDSADAREAPSRVAATDQAPAARAKIAAAPSQAAPAPAEAQAGDESSQEPQAWLLKIESMLKAGRQKEALDEWRGFRRAYPVYAVPKELRARIDALTRDGGPPP